MPIKTNSSGFAHLVLIVFTAVAIAGGFYLVKDKINLRSTTPIALTTNPSTKNQSSEQPTNCKSTSKKPPYVKTDPEKTVGANIGPEGGVIDTTLPKGVKVYLVIPPLTTPMTSYFGLVPYQEPPCNPKHGLLSEELGYGVQIVFDSLSPEFKGFLVFDTTGGKASQSEFEKGKGGNRCDPHFSTFNPYLCASKNKLPLEKFLDPKDVFVTPQFHSDGNILVHDTIPTGIDGLFALKVKKSDVYIPQRINEKLAKNLVDKSLGKTDSLEAAAIALKYQIPLTYNQISLISTSTSNISGADDLSLKNYLVLKNLDKFSRVDEDKDSDLQLRKKFGEYKDLKKSAESTLKTIVTKITEIINQDLKSSNIYDSHIESAATNNYLSSEQYQGSSIGKPWTGPDVSDDHSVSQMTNHLEMAEHSYNTMTPEQQNKVTKELSDKVNKAIDERLSNPNISIEELMDIMNLCQRMGRSDCEEDAKKKIQEKAIKILSDNTASDEEVIRALTACQGVSGCLDKFKELLKAKFKATQGGGKESECLTHKTLADYGINTCEIQKDL